MMAYWLMKSEPDVYSIDDLARDKRTFWNGIRSYAGRNFMRDEMQPGDLALFYHSNADPSAVVGVMEIVSKGKPDPTQFDKKAGEDMGFDPKSKPDAPTWFGVDVAIKEKWTTPVNLQQIKAEPKLRSMKLLKVSRLSVSPVTAAEWKVIVGMAGR